jgi:opacity protein-like surface antigen
MKLLSGKTVSASFIVALTAAAPLSAQDGGLRFGAQLSYVAPVGGGIKPAIFVTPPGGDGPGEPITVLGDSGTHLGSGGYSLAALAEWNFHPKMALRAKADYLLFGEKTHTVPQADGVQKDKINGLNLAADFIYHFETNETGIFVFAGLGYGDIKIEGRYASPDLSDGGSLSGNGLVFGFGAGYNFTRNIGAEVKYNMLPVDLGLAKTDYELDNYNHNWLQVSFTYRF